MLRELGEQLGGLVQRGGAPMAVSTSSRAADRMFGRGFARGHRQVIPWLESVSAPSEFARRFRWIGAASSHSLWSQSIGVSASRWQGRLSGEHRHRRRASKTGDLPDRWKESDSIGRVVTFYLAQHAAQTIRRIKISRKRGESFEGRDSQVVARRSFGDSLSLRSRRARSPRRSPTVGYRADSGGSPAR